MSDTDARLGPGGNSARERWARFRFSLIGPLLAAPPSKQGELREQLEKLAERVWKHPVTGAPVTFGISTLERWYYAAREAIDPVGALKNRPRRDWGAHPSLSIPLRDLLRAQHREHPSWSWRLHYDNLAVLVQERPQELGPLPSYSVVRRWMKREGLLRQPRRRRSSSPSGRPTSGAVQAQERLQSLEVRSYEALYVGSLWHADFHSGSRQVLTRGGQWVTPEILAFLDDKSRLCCHAQWYLAETAENFVHGLSQALLKRGLPRALMTDNGSAMLAAEVQEGLLQLGLVHERTMAYSAYQNGKQEHFWTLIEGRLMAMLEKVPDLTLELLNEATQAFVELEYNRTVHSEIGQTPLKCFLATQPKPVLRDSPGVQDLRRAFRMKEVRTQRRSDGTLTVQGVRFEVPSRFRHLQRLGVRYARWDLSSVDLWDERNGVVLATIYPLNKTRNAEGTRRALKPWGGGGGGGGTEPPPSSASSSGMAPLLKKLLADYAALGVPPAYLVKNENKNKEEEER